ncbi:MAG: TrkH family potassium uptake protein [Clostridiales bacterium]|nr:TrkH family potassium uptake protein [Clostridiales bacterium]
MNFSIIKRTLGWILLFEAVFFLVPMITAAIYWEEEFFAFMITMLVCGVFGGFCLIGKPKNTNIYAKEGCVIVALSWIVMSLFGALPLFFSGVDAYSNYVDALFEIVSGFTTTGATIVPTGAQVAALPKCILMWRSFSHWVGGMGVLVFIMAFLPLSGARNLYIMKAESPGPEVSKLVPRVRKTALILYVIYTGMTVVEFVMLLCGGMSIFEAINASFATAGTGGFSVKADGFLGYSSYLQIVVTVFMLLFSMNFTSYYLIGKGKFKDAFNAEIRAFLWIVLAAITLVTLNLHFTQSQVLSGGAALKHSAFSVASVISTTGFATVDFAEWPAFAQTVLVVIMFIGACAGSTGGGIKVSRVVIMGKGAYHEVGRMLHPKLVKKITMDKQVVSHEVVRSVTAFFMAYVLIFVVSLLLISLDGMDTTTNFTAVAATINNIGPGLGRVSPAGSFADFSGWSKIVFIFDMLVGRLEVFPMLVLFAPKTWKKGA